MHYHQKRQRNGPDDWFRHLWHTCFHLLLQLVLAVISSLLAQMFLSLFHSWLR